MPAQRNYYPPAGSLRREVVTLYGRIVLGANGAIATNVDRRSSGFNVVKTAGKTGRYTITFDDIGYTLLGGSATIIGPDDAAMTSGRGIVAVLRDNDLNTDGTIEVQFLNSSTYADAEVQDNLTVFFRFDLSRVSQ